MKDKNNTLIFAGLAVVCVLLVILSTVRGTWLSPIKTGVGYVLTPLQNGVNRVSIAIKDTLELNHNMDELRAENAALRNTIDELTVENTRLEAESYELQRLRDLFSLNQEYGQYKTIGARIIAKDSAGWFDIFKIDKGSDDGILVDMNVIADGGLVGIVIEVGKNFSMVRSIVDDSSRVSSMTLRTHSGIMVSGSLEAYSKGKILIEDIAYDADIKPGDKIVTSNVSTKFLPNILIGYVSDVDYDSNNLTKHGYAIPVSDLSSLQEVLVVLDLKEQK